MARTTKLTIKDGAIYQGTIKKATIDSDTKSIKDLYNGGGEIISELIQALKDSKEYGWEPEDLSDNQIRDAKDIWEIIPEAPRPSPNSLGDKHPDVYDYVEANYPYVHKIRYRFGRYNKDLAGLGINLSPFRDKNGKGRGISKQAEQMIEKQRAEMKRNAEEYLKNNG
jgi:hypothetical protein